MISNNNFPSLLSNKTFTINSRKIDQRIQKSWEAILIESKESLFIFKGIFEKEISHSHLGVIRAGTISYEYYWLDRWYNVFRFEEPEGGLRNFYCNVNQPPTIDNNVLDYIDLDIDVLVWKNFNFEILDVEEHKENAKKFNYPSSLKKNIETALQQILNLIESRSFPFNLELDN